MKVGAFDYVLKPFRLQTVLPVLTRAMNTRHMRLENLQLRETVAIHDLAQTIAFTLDPQTVISKLADAALQQTDADEVSILLPTSPGSDELYVAAVRGENRERLLGERVTLEESITGWIVREREPLILEGEVNDERFQSLWPHPAISSSISIPMQVANKLVGTININALSRARPFTLGQMKALTILSTTAAAALETASLYTQVQQAERNYRSIFENAVEGIFQSTPEGRFITVNPSMAAILGYDSPEELVATITDVTRQLYVHPEDRDRVAQLQAEHGVVHAFEFEAYRRDGEKVWLSVNRRSARDGSGAEIYREGSIEDITTRKRAQEEKDKLNAEIEDQRQRLKDVVGSVPGVVWEAYGNPDAATQRINFVSDYVETMLGYSVEDWLSTPNLWLTIVHPDDREEAGRVAGEAFASGKGSTQEFRWLAKDGRAVWVESNYVVVSDEEGQPLGLRGVTIDITERKRAERALRESEARKRAILQSALDCIVTMDHDGLVVDWNPAAERTFGYLSKDAIGKEMAELIIPPSLRRQHRRGLERYLATGHGPVLGNRLELSAMRADGSEFPIELAINRIESQGLPMFTGYIRDITERQRAELALRESEERYRDLVENAHDIIYEHDLDGNYTSTNKAGEQITGYSLAETLELNLAQTVAPEYMEKARQMFRRKLAGEMITAYELEIITKRGKRVAVEVNTRLVYQNGKPVGVQGIARDVTERKQLEERLRQSQKLEAIGQLAGGVAHDFNNLLTVIGGYSSILLGKLPQDSPHRSSIEEIKKAGDRASGLTRQLLAFSRKQILQPKVLDLNVVVTDLEKMVRRLIGEDIDLLSVTSPSLGKVRADPGQIEQVLLNLIVNARDAMPKGGKLTIETRNVVLSGDYAHRHAAQPGSYVMLAVSDTGCGMDPTVQPRIFEPFFTTKGSGKGTGLGLATVYGIVKQSGGNIWVYSEVGRGSTFKIYLPRVDEAAEGEEVISKSIPQGTEMVLLVEDEDQVRAILKHILEGQGYQVLAASNGEEALSISQDLKRDIRLMITDVVMPQMSGRELAERVLTVRPSLPVLFMSGYTDDAIVRHGLLDEKLNFIQKPFDSTTVARKVREVLDSHR